jgi:hypothetical protein
MNPLTRQLLANRTIRVLRTPVNLAAFSKFAAFRITIRPFASVSDVPG